MTYEVFYATGGHCGPFNTLMDAVNHAIRRNESAFMVAIRTAEPIGEYKPIGGYIPVRVYQTESGHYVSDGIDNIQRHQIPLEFHWMLN